MELLEQTPLPQSTEIGIPLATTRPFSNMMCLSAPIGALIMVTKKTSAGLKAHHLFLFFFQVDHFPFSTHWTLIAVCCAPVGPCVSPLVLCHINLSSATEPRTVGV